MTVGCVGKCLRKTEESSSGFEDSSLCNLLRPTAAHKEVCNILRRDGIIRNTPNIQRGPEDRKVLYSGITRQDKVFKHVEGCYCRQPLVKPRLRLQPRDSCQKPVEKLKISSTHGVKRLPKDQQKVKNAQTQTYTSDHDGDESLVFTSRREEYEKTRRSNEGSSLSKSIESNSSVVSLKEVGEFRKENYFDTHSVGGDVPEHKCVHKFKINNRFLPEAVNADPYGISRCIICNKVMDAPGVSPTLHSTSPKKNRVGTMKKIYEYGLKRPAVNIGSGREVIKIIVPDIFEEGEDFKLSKHMAPFDSLALRYQKGVI